MKLIHSLSKIKKKRSKQNSITAERNDNKWNKNEYFIGEKKQSVFTFVISLFVFFYLFIR